MKNKSEKIVFFGSGPVAARSLESLVGSFEIEAVVTKPATLEMMQHATQGKAGSWHALSTRAELDDLLSRRFFISRLGVIVDFGIIVSRHVIEAFPLGIVNSHFSLLPEWRGADPITFAVLSGQKKTGVSLMLVDEKLDEGPLLAQKEVTIQSKVTTPELTSQLISVSNAMLAKYLPKYLAGELTPYPQDLSKPVTYSRKLTKADGLIDWHKPAEQIEREIRAYCEWPKSFTRLGAAEVIIKRAEVVRLAGPVGEPKIDKASLIVYCGQDALRLTRLQPIGKKEMDAAAFITGYKRRLSEA